jgi:glycosyltransferase involved in cell wall biosynthesis
VRRLAYELAHAVFVVSEEMRQYFCRETGFALDRMRVIHNGVDVAAIERADARGVREEFGLAARQTLSIGTVARFQETKDLPTLVRAFAQLRQRHAARPLAVDRRWR